MARTTRSKRPASAKTKKVAKKPARPAKKKTAAAKPLLASAPKKVGKVTEAARPKAKAPYQPKADPPPLDRAPKAVAVPALDPLALVRPWMRLGVDMTLSGLALQARIAKAALNAPPAAIALRQGAAAYSAWLAIAARTAPGKTEA